MSQHSRLMIALVPSYHNSIKQFFYLFHRCRGIFKQLKMADFTNVHIEALGSEHNYGPMSQMPQVYEVFLKMKHFQTVYVASWVETTFVQTYFELVQFKMYRLF